MGTPNSATLDAQELRDRNGGKPRRELREFKFVVQPVLLIVEEGKVVGEQAAEPVALYGLDALLAFADAFHTDLDSLNAQLEHAPTD